MKVLITGGSGFIGSHLAQEYLGRSDEVCVIDDLSTGQISNISEFEQNKNFSLVTDTILNHGLMSHLIEKCDLVVHLAAAVGVSYIIENPLKSMQTNIRGSEIVLELANKFGKKIIIASSSEVYGKDTHTGLKEDDDIIYGPSTTWRWSYAASKLIDEFMGLAYFRTKKLSVVIVRFFNIIGPRQTGFYGMVVPRFIKQALTDEPITVYGDGKQSRTFTYVKDAVQAVMKLAECDSAAGEVVNIGGTTEISIGDLAIKIKEKTQSKSEIKNVPYEQVYPKHFEDMMRRVPSVEKLKRLINYTPQTDLDTTLDKTIEYLREDGADGDSGRD